HGMIVIRDGVRVFAGKRREGSVERAENRVEQDSFELAGRLLDSMRARIGRLGGRYEGGCCDSVHQITSRSAWSAPAGLMACSMAITSVAVAPIFCSPFTSCSTLAPSVSSILRAGACSAFTVCSGTTSVLPLDKGLGCETVSSVATTIERLPCRIETAPRRTSLPITTVPVRSLTTTRA